LILTSSFPRGPNDETCGYVREFARRLSNDFNVVVLAPPDTSGDGWPGDDFVLLRSPSPMPARIDAFQASQDLNDLPRASLIRKIASAFSMALFVLTAIRLARKADVICSHWILPSGLAGALASLLFRKPHVVVEHSGALHLLSRLRSGRIITRFIVKHSRRVITVSSHLKEVLISLHPEAEPVVEVIPMGASPMSSSRKALKVDTRTALFIGRLTEIKGVELLLHALNGIRNVHLIVAGEGERRKALEDVAARLKSNTTFLGQVGAEEKAGLLALCDFVVIPSLVLPGGRCEGVPVACLESLMAGRPVIASRAGGLPEVIVDGHNGLLFAPGDKDALASAINRLIADPALHDHLSVNARLTARAFDWEEIGKRFARAINCALEENDKRIGH
jgi:glycosyltransferase involved in cell wall biosynthesis